MSTSPNFRTESQTSRGMSEERANEIMSQYKIRPAQPRTLRGKLAHGAWWAKAILTNSFWGVYMIGLFVANRIWRIGSDPKRKQFRPLDLSKPLKVGIVSEYYFPHIGGLTGDVHYAAVELNKLGHDVKLITTNVDPENNITRSKHGFEIIRIGRSTPFIANGSLAKIAYGWALGSKVKKIIEEQKFDVLHIHCPTSPVLPVLFQIHADCPIVGHLHTLLKRKSFLYSTFRRQVARILNDYEGLVSVSETAARPFRQLFACDFRVIPNGVPVHHFTKPKPKIARFDDGRYNIFFIGRIEPRNGLAILIDAFKIIHKEEPKTRLIIAGDGPWKQAFMDSVPEDIRSEVHFVGAVQRDKPNWFETGDLNICPTAATTASLGVTLLESMASGRPTVCSDIPAFNETVTPNVDVLVAKADSPEDFARQALRIIRDPALGERLAKAAVRTIEERFSWTSIIGRVDDYTNEILEKIHGVKIPSKTKQNWIPPSVEVEAVQSRAV